MSDSEDTHELVYVAAILLKIGRDLHTLSKIGVMVPEAHRVALDAAMTTLRYLSNQGYDKRQISMQALRISGLPGDDAIDIVNGNG